jgi:hypothetical protein
MYSNYLLTMKCPDTNWTVRADLPTPPEPKTTTLNSRIVRLNFATNI